MELFTTIQSYLSELGLIGVFIVMFSENLGIPFPTEVGFLITQSLISNHSITFTLGIVVIMTGHVSGAIVGYAIGRWGDKRLTRLFERNKNLQSTRTKIVSWYEKYGNATVFFTRLVGYVRPWSSLVAGFANVPFWPFLLWTFLGSLIFSITSLIVTKYLIVFWHTYPQLHTVTIGVSAVLFFAVFLYQAIKRGYARIHRR